MSPKLIAHYRITAKLGEGGMGEVWRATDTKLNREVAIKILPDAFAQDAGRMARFQREAQVLASLNHPNIASIYGVEEQALVMELVEGEAPHGPMPFEDAWNIASQIASALEYAHDKGIIHRDLKPANVKITPDGVVKLLDFGLAKAFTDPASTSGDPEISPTLTLGATQVGVILGTAGYMAPEQAKGKVVDQRADIWAFGVLLYELLTGERLFGGEDVADTLAQVLTKQPDCEKAPGQARMLLRRCLEKNPKERLRHIGDARFLIAPHDPVPNVSGLRRRRERTAWLAAGVFAVAALGFAYLSYGHLKPEPAHVLKLSILPPDRTTLDGYSSIPAVSPDGRRLAMTMNVDGKSGLWIRELDSLSTRPLPGTEGASLPFWSPDSRFVGFFASGKLKKIDVTGGPAVTLCDASNGRGGTWNQNDSIVFTPAPVSGLFRVSAEGGTPTPVTTPDPSWPGSYHRAPWFLPDGHHVLWTARSGQTPNKNAIYVGDIDAKDPTRASRRLVVADSNAVYASGYLLFARDRTLMAQRFHADLAEITGAAFPVAENVDYFPVNSQGQFSVSKNGVLAYTSAGSQGVQLTWFDRFGKMTRLAGAPADIHSATISPDGHSVAFDRRDQTGLRDLWLLDLVRGTESRFTFGPQDSENDEPVWSPDGSHIIFESRRGSSGPNGAGLYQRSSSGTGADEMLLGGGPIRPTDWSRDGRYLILTDRRTSSKFQIWVLPLFEDRKPFRYVQGDFNAGLAKISPDGRWLAYMSDESQRNEIYVVPFPNLGGKWQVSVNGGMQPLWSRDGKELYFIGADRKLMATDVRSRGDKFEAGMPKPLFQTHAAAVPGGVFADYDVSSDGRFLIPEQIEQPASASVTVVINWTAGLKN